MFIYIVLLFIYTGLSIVDIKQFSKKSRLIYVLLLISPFFILSAFRSTSVGADTLSYSLAFEKVKSSTSLFNAFNETYMERGYVLVEYVFGKTGLSYYSFQLFVSIFCFSSLGFFFYKNSKNVAMSCFLFLTMQGFFGLMNQTRMWIAISVLLFCYETLKNRHFIFTLGLIVFASFFHTSAIIFLIVFPFVFFYKRARNLTLIISTILGIAIAALGQTFFKTLFDTFERYQGYSKSTFFRINMASILFIVEYLLSFVIITRQKKRIISKNSFGHVNSANTNLEWDYNLICSVSFLTFIVSLAGIQNTFMTRVISYFSVFLYAFLGNCFTFENRKKNWLTFAVAIVLFASQLFYIMLERQIWDRVIPYEFLF